MNRFLKILVLLFVAVTAQAATYNINCSDGVNAVKTWITNTATYGDKALVQPNCMRVQGYDYDFSNFTLPAKSGLGIVEAQLSITMMHYSTGTITITQGSSSVVGSGTSWDSSMIGARITVGDATNWTGFWGYVSSVQDATHLTMTFPWPWATYTGSGKAYWIGERAQSCNVDNPGSGYTVAPSVRIGKRGNDNMRAHTTISGGGVNACILDDRGTDYSAAPGVMAQSREKFITIQSSEIGMLPANRVWGLTDKIHMPKFQNNVSGPTLLDQPGSQYYAFDGIEWTTFIPCTNNTGCTIQSAMFNPIYGKHYEFTHSYIHPPECPNDGGVGNPLYYTSGRFTFAIEAQDVLIQNNDIHCWYGRYYTEDITALPVDNENFNTVATGAIIDIDNNYLDGWFTPYFMGGADAYVNMQISAQGTPTSTTFVTTNTTNLPPIGYPFAIEYDAEPLVRNISSITRSGTNYVIDTSSAHNLANNAYIQIVGVTDSTFNSRIGSSAEYLPLAPVTVVDSDTFMVPCNTLGNTCTASTSSSGGREFLGIAIRNTGTHKNWVTAKYQGISGSTITFSDPTQVYANYGAGGATVALNVSAWANPTTALVPKSGGQAQWSGGMPSDISMTRNTVHFDPVFSMQVYTNNPPHNTPKGSPFESKYWNGGLVKGNVLDGAFVGLAFNTTQQYQGSPWITNQDITLRDNVWKQTSVQHLAQGAEYSPNYPNQRLRYVNNVAMGYPANDPYASYINTQCIVDYNNALSIEVVHNTTTCGMNQYPYKAMGNASLNFNFTKTSYSNGRGINPVSQLVYSTLAYRSNLQGYGNYGFQCGPTDNPWTDCTSIFVESHNLFSTVPGAIPATTGCCSNFGPNSNPFSSSMGASPYNVINCDYSHALPCAYSDWALVGMEDPDGLKMYLKATSLGHNAAHDGKDIGADINAINAAIGPNNTPLLAPGSVGNGGRVGSGGFGAGRLTDNRMKAPIKKKLPVIGSLVRLVVKERNPKMQGLLPVTWVKGSNSKWSVWPYTVEGWHQYAR